MAAVMTAGTVAVAKVANKEPAMLTFKAMEIVHVVLWMFL